jgi:hypothetical protein
MAQDAFLTDPNNPEYADISRQRKLAEMLTLKAFEQPQGNLVSGRYVAPSWTQQLAPLISGIAGQAMGSRLDEKQLKLVEALRGKSAEETQKIIELSKTDPNAALAIASNAETAQGRAFAPALMNNLIPKTPDDVAKFKYAQTPEGGGFKGSYNDFANQMNEYQKLQAANDAKRLSLEGQRVGLDAARFNLEKNKTEVNPAEAPLRTSFLNQAAPHIQISQAYRKIENAPDTAAGDMSKIFGFMKILDPGSTVREGEYASAENARGVPDTVRAQYNKVSTGQRLTPNQRKEFTQAAADLVKSQEQQFGEMAKYYTEISATNRINPANVIYNPYKDLNLQTTPPKMPKPAANQPLPAPAAAAPQKSQLDPKLLQFMTPEQQALFGVTK